MTLRLCNTVSLCPCDPAKIQIIIQSPTFNFQLSTSFVSIAAAIEAVHAYFFFWQTNGVFNNVDGVEL